MKIATKPLPGNKFLRDAIARGKVQDAINAAYIQLVRNRTPEEWRQHDDYMFECDRADAAGAAIEALAARFAAWWDRQPGSGDYSSPRYRLLSERAQRAIVKMHDRLMG